MRNALLYGADNENMTITRPAQSNAIQFKRQRTFLSESDGARRYSSDRLRHDIPVARLVLMSVVGRDEWFSVGESPSI